MNHKYDELPKKVLTVNFDQVVGELDYSRQMVGIGGANVSPIPENIIQPIKDLENNMIRVFLQEYFFVYPDHNVFDWNKLDAFMDSLEKTGAKILASICLKPKVLYPAVDPKIFWPNDEAEWQNVVYELVRRYSVERRIVTHWGVLNEINIGENGGCPHEIKNPDDYYAFYRMTVEAIVKAWPEAKVGGPSLAGFDKPYMEKFIKLVSENKTPCHFVSYNIYSGNTADHANAARETKELLDRAGMDAEIYQTELNTWFPSAYVEEAAYSGRYASSLAAVLMDLNETPITGSFQFDMYDAYVDPDDFEQFYSITPFMLRHWNEIPHRFGLFDMDGNVRPQYFVYQMLKEMKGKRLNALSEDGDIRICASERYGVWRLLIVNFGEEKGEDKVADIHMTGVTRGLYRFERYCLDDRNLYDTNAFKMKPVENRLSYALSEYAAHVYLPEDSVTMITFTPAKE